MRVVIASTLGLMWLAMGCRTATPAAQLSADLESSTIVMHCFVAKGGADRQAVTPQIISGAQIVDEQVVNYAGHKVSVLFNQGDQSESQQVLTLRFDDRVTQVYDPTQSLYKIGDDDGVELQCYVEDGVMAPTTQNMAPQCVVDQGGANRQTVAVTTISGAQVAAPTVTNYGGHKLTAVFNKGDQFESQQLLWLTMDGTYNQTYDPGRSLYKLVHDDGTQMQCYFGQGGSDASNPPTGNDQVSCTIDKHGTQSANLAVQTVGGAEVAEWEFRDYLGHKAAVRFVAGDEFEGQQILWVRLDDRHLKVYDPTKSLYKLTAADGVTIQCYNENGVPAANQTGDSLGCTVDKQGNDRKDVPPTVIAGPEVATPTVVQHSGHKVSAVFNEGDQFDSQQLLWPRMDGYEVQIYDPGSSLTVLEANDGTKLQCYFAAGH